MKSWYPDPKLSIEECQSHDRSWNKTSFKRVETTYDFSNKSDISGVCGYTNGIFNSDQFVNGGSNSIRDGTVTSFKDNKVYDKSADEGNYPKRIYCIYLQFKSSNIKNSFECSVGLSPDGMPMDLGKVNDT